jgi:hypothetical protein
MLSKDFAAEYETSFHYIQGADTTAVFKIEVGIIHCPSERDSKNKYIIVSEQC